MSNVFVRSISNGNLFNKIDSNLDPDPKLPVLCLPPPLHRFALHVQASEHSHPLICQHYSRTFHSKPPANGIDLYVNGFTHHFVRAPLLIKCLVNPGWTLSSAIPSIRTLLPHRLHDCPTTPTFCSFWAGISFWVQWGPSSLELTGHRSQSTFRSGVGRLIFSEHLIDDCHLQKTSIQMLLHGIKVYCTIHSLKKHWHVAE